MYLSLNTVYCIIKFIINLYVLYSNIIARIIPVTTISTRLSKYNCSYFGSLIDHNLVLEWPDNMVDESASRVFVAWS